MVGMRKAPKQAAAYFPPLSFFVLGVEDFLGGNAVGRWIGGSFGEATTGYNPITLASKPSHLSLSRLSNFQT